MGSHFCNQRTTCVGWRNGEQCFGAVHAVGASRDMPCVMMGCERWERDALSGLREEGGDSVSLEAENRIVEMENG